MKLRNMIAVGALVVLSACSSLGLTPATSPSQGLAYAYGTVAAVRSSAAAALTAGTLSTSQGQQILDLTDKARASLDAGEMVVVSNPTNVTGVAGYLSTATSLLTEAQALLPKLSGTPLK
jgi:hypothetical protein